MPEKFKKTTEEREGQMTAAIDTIKEQITEFQARCQTVSIADPADEASDEARERAGVLEQITKEREALNESQELLKGLLTKTVERTRVNTTKHPREGREK